MLKRSPNTPDLLARLIEVAGSRGFEPRDTQGVKSIAERALSL